MKIRKARKEDIDSIARLYIKYLKYLGGFARFINKKKNLINRKELKTAIKKRINSSNKNIFLVAEKNRDIIGFVQAEVMYPKESRNDKKIVEIIDIYAKSKRKGIGEMLLKEVEKWANSNKAQFIQWEFIHGNKIAEKFCIKNKFKYFKIKMLRKLR